MAMLLEKQQLQSKGLLPRMLEGGCSRRGRNSKQNILLYNVCFQMLRTSLKWRFIDDFTVRAADLTCGTTFSLPLSPSPSLVSSDPHTYIYLARARALCAWVFGRGVCVCVCVCVWAGVNQLEHVLEHVRQFPLEFGICELGM